MSRQNHSLRKNLSWIGFALSVLGVLSYFLLATDFSFGMAFLVGDPRRFGLYLFGASVLFHLLNLVWWRSFTTNEPLRLIRQMGITVILALMYIFGTYLFYEYRQENVHFSNGEFELAGTLMTPHEAGPHPALIFMHGGLGPEFLQSRWNLYQLGSHFARHGVATLIYDKRGHGESDGRRSDEIPFQALADDVLGGVEFLKNKEDIDPNQIGIWAISQGGWPAPIAASRSDDVAFLIIVSGGGASPSAEWAFDARVALEDANYSEDEINQLMPHLSALRGQINQYYQTGKGYDEMVEALRQAHTEDWMIRTRDAAEQILPSPEQLFRHGDEITNHFLANWNFDPLPVIKDLDIPILFIYGGQDRVVNAMEMADNLQPLTTLPDKEIEVVIYPNAEHSMIDGASWLPRLSEGYLDKMTSWVHARQ